MHKIENIQHRREESDPPGPIASVPCPNDKGQVHQCDDDQNPSSCLGNHNHQRRRHAAALINDTGDSEK